MSKSCQWDNSIAQGRPAVAHQLPKPIAQCIEFAFHMTKALCSGRSADRMELPLPPPSSTLGAHGGTQVIGWNFKSDVTFATKNPFTSTYPPLQVPHSSSRGGGGGGGGGGWRRRRRRVEEGGGERRREGGGGSPTFKAMRNTSIGFQGTFQLTVFFFHLNSFNICQRTQGVSRG